MATQKSRSTENGRKIVLPGNMEIGSLDEIYQQMSRIASRKRKQFTIDGGEVAIIDSAGIQLLIAFIQALVNKGCEVAWENYSVQIYQLADELGVADQLGE